jgi:leucine dehydrogenase
VGSAFVQLLVEARAKVVVADSFPPALEAAKEKFGVETVPLGEIHQVECDIFSPCALGGVLNEETIPEMSCKAVVGSANNQLATEKDAERLHDRGILYAPDFVVNAGGVINCFDELQGYNRERALYLVDSIYHSTKRILEVAETERILPVQAAEKVAEQRISEIGDLRRFRRSGDDRA